MTLTIGSIVDACVWLSPSAAAATLGTSRMTFAELDSNANRVARVLASSGAGRGDLVAWWAGAALRTLDGFVACARLGAVFAPVNPALPAGEAGEILEYIQPAVPSISQPAALPRRSPKSR